MNSIEIKETHLFNSNNFVPTETNKRRIVLGSTNRQTITSKNKVDQTFFTILKSRIGGKNLQTPMYSIDIFGEVYRHFPDEYYSNYIIEELMPEEAISITLHNEGYLNFNNSLLSYSNWDNKKYLRSDKIVNIEWRGHNYWAPYTDKQYEALLILIPLLLEKYNIPSDYINTITTNDMAYKFDGVISRSNLLPTYLDLTPAFDWEKIK